MEAEAPRYSRHVPGGVEEVPSAEFHSFAAVPVVSGGGRKSLVVTIPVGIVKALGIQRGDILEVAVRKITPEECTAIYGSVPARVRRGTVPIKCPVCGEEGRLSLVYKEGRPYLSVLHGRVRHHVPVKLVEFYEEWVPKLAGRGSG